jgi:hypothetical protein
MLPNELPTPPNVPGAYRLQKAVEAAIDYARSVHRASPESTTPAELRDYFRAAALLLPSGKPASKKD